MRKGWPRRVEHDRPGIWICADYANVPGFRTKRGSIQLEPFLGFDNDDFSRSVLAAGSVAPCASSGLELVELRNQLARVKFGIRPRRNGTRSTTARRFVVAAVDGSPPNEVKPIRRHLLPVHSLRARILQGSNEVVRLHVIAPVKRHGPDGVVTCTCDIGKTQPFGDLGTLPNGLCVEPEG